LALTASASITVRDKFGSSVGTVSAGSRAWLFVTEDGAGNRTPLLLT
jgi:hypothetical protein